MTAMASSPQSLSHSIPQTHGSGVTFQHDNVTRLARRLERALLLNDAFDVMQ